MACDIPRARKRFAQAQAFEEKQQRRELEDLSFYEGEGQWPSDIAQARSGQPAQNGMPAVPARPMITVNKVREPIRHVVNEERAADLGIEIIPTDDFGTGVQRITEQEIEIREGLVRRIQRESYAIDARIWAAERAAIAGRGYYGIMTRYLPGKTFDQEIYHRRFYDQGGLLLDPAHEEPDGSDIDFAFVPTWIPFTEYQVKYPTRAHGRRNTLGTLGEADFKTLAAKQGDWFKSQNDQWMIRVVEDWEYERTTRGLAYLEDGSVLWDDELTPDQRDRIQDVREVIDKRVKFYLLDGEHEDKTPLEETEWAGKYIPIIKVVGEEIQPFDAQRRFEGMVRPARSPQQGENYMVSKMVEMIGLTPVPPLMLTPSMIEGFTNMYESMATRNWPYLLYNAVDPVTGQPNPEPRRPPVATDIAAVSAAIAMFDQAIKSTTAVPDATLGNVDPSVRSGKGIQALALNALKATAHFGDNFQRSISFEGRILNDLLYPIYGRRHGRKVQVFTKERQTKTVTISRPDAMTEQTPGDPVYTLTPDMGFSVTAKVTRNYDTLREQEQSTVMEAVNSAPEFMLPLIGDLAFKYQDGPGHNEIAERMKYGLRPEIQAAMQGNPQNPQMAALQAENQQLKMAIQAKTPELQAKQQIAQMQEQGEMQRAAAANQVQIEKTLIQATAQEAIAQAKIDAENFRSYVDASENKIAQMLNLHLERVSQQMQQTHEHVQNALDRIHEVNLARVQHAQALEQGQQQASMQADQQARQQAHEQGMAAQAPQDQA